jgi:alpha-tubulin suppressor-like RCC1 family protein
VYTFGFGEYGTLGHGGSIFEERPRLIKKLDTRVIVSVACGLYHTLALSEVGDVYAWGRGFEGQLGILQDVECSSSPHLIASYFKKVGDQYKKLEKKRIQEIACGAYHSLAIDTNGDLFCWGEARYGQTGTGKRIKDALPTLVQINKDGNNQKVKMATGGFGHTLCLTT